MNSSNLSVRLIVEAAQSAGTSAEGVSIEQLLGEALLANSNMVMPAGTVTVIGLSPDDTVLLTPSDQGVRISGNSVNAAWPIGVSTLLLVGGWEGQATMAVIDAKDAVVSPLETVSTDPRALVHCDLVVQAARLIPLGRGVNSELVALLQSALLLGTMRTVLSLSTRHAREREQFGRTLDRFQAIQRLLAEMAAEVECLSAIVGGAVAEAAHNGPGTLSAVAKSTASRGAAVVAAAAHQIHGAIGFTQEHPLYRYTTRLWAVRGQGGSEGHWNEKVWQEVSSSLKESADRALWPALADIIDGAPAQELGR